MRNITPRCWNCGNADKWTEVVAMEKCDNCGIACYYHGGGANDAYNDAMEEKYAREERMAAEEEALHLSRQAELDREHEDGNRYLNESEYY